jgi:hypothetical protein
MKGHRSIGVMLAAAVTAAASVAFAAPASASIDGYWIKNRGSGLCLQPAGNSALQGVLVVQVGCDITNPYQRWRSVASSTTEILPYRIRNVGSQLCLNAHGGATNHTPVDQWQCNEISNEKWDFVRDNSGVRSRVSGTTSHCLDVPEARSDADVAMQLYKCNSTDAQNWDMYNPDGPIIT